MTNKITVTSAGTVVNANVTPALNIGVAPYVQMVLDKRRHILTAIIIIRLKTELYIMTRDLL